jgi:Spy/CpxP family protein refolding chaperone
MIARFSTLLCLLLAALIVLPSYADDTADDDRPKVKLPSYWAGMANKVGLDYDQRVKLKSALDAEKAAEAELKPQIDQAQADRRAAREAGDDAAEEQAKQRVSDLRDQLRQAEATRLIAVRDLLTGEQVVEWEYARLLFSMNLTFKKYDLTDDQRQTLEQVTRAAATQLAALEADDVKGSDELIDQTKDSFYLEHLTEAQQQAHPRRGADQSD